MAYYLEYPPKSDREVDYVIRVVLIFPQEELSERNASACENHPTRERRYAEGRENDRGQGSLKSQKFAQSLNETR